MTPSPHADTIPSPESGDGPLLVCLAGPTASGKSAAAMALAARWPVEIIVMDSATLYRGMDIGTAKPSAEDRAAVAHHLLDIRDPAQSYSAAAFARDAAACARDIRARGRIPLLCGGTLLYYKALREGLHELPGANAGIRAALDDEATRAGWPALHAELERVDPATAARLAPHDRQRIQRALEIWRGSGRTLSDWRAQPVHSALPGWRHLAISLEPGSRQALHQRIAQRYRAMMAAGLLDEVRALHQRPDLHEDLPAIRSVGYRQLWDHLEGRVDLETAIMRAIAATRQLAKRQITWLRAMPERRTIDCLSPQSTGEVVDAFGQIMRTWGEPCA